jgi:hypothetical protein
MKFVNVYEANMRNGRTVGCAEDQEARYLAMGYAKALADENRAFYERTRDGFIVWSGFHTLADIRIEAATPAVGQDQPALFQAAQERGTR